MINQKTHKVGNNNVANNANNGNQEVALPADTADPGPNKCAFEYCGICNQLVTSGEAKLLGCLHTFCTSCIEQNERARSSGMWSKFELLAKFVHFFDNFFVEQPTWPKLFVGRLHNIGLLLGHFYFDNLCQTSRTA